MEKVIEQEIARAAEAIAEAEALVITAGAGMGVDSGLPDFRGAEGFWRAYPPLAKLGLRFEEMADPEWFHRDPTLVWGFYGHRLNLYRETTPHPGFALLRRWAESKPGGYFVYTSNVDGQFQKAGFDPERIAECHGSIHHFQCTLGCEGRVWGADSVTVDVDLETMRAAIPVPSCPVCRYVARPNLLMFGDWHWIGRPYEAQENRLMLWEKDAFRSRLSVAIIECGAGKTLASIRRYSENLRSRGATLIRINPRDPETTPGQIALPLGALDALTRIDAAMGS